MLHLMRHPNAPSALVEDARSEEHLVQVDCTAFIARGFSTGSPASRRSRMRLLCCLSMDTWVASVALTTCKNKASSCHPRILEILQLSPKPGEG